jgi:hypothetical protein
MHPAQNLFSMQKYTKEKISFLFFRSPIKVVTFKKYLLLNLSSEKQK